MRILIDHCVGRLAGSRLRLRSVAALGALVLASMPGSALATKLLVAAGGGGGAPASISAFASLAEALGNHGQTGTSGSNGTSNGGGIGGTNGYGATTGPPMWGLPQGGGGAGWLSSGATGLGFNPYYAGGGSSGPSFAGGAGAESYILDDGTVWSDNGGFGGGGGGGRGLLGSGGGGGGYSGGGGGGFWGFGGGGGSYVDADWTLVHAMSGANWGPNAEGIAANGYLEIGSDYFEYSGTIGDYVVPVSGTYSIHAQGGAGGSNVMYYNLGGGGAYIDASGYLLAGTVLKFVIGGGGEAGAAHNWDTGEWTELGGGGGGGGTFVWIDSLPSSGVPEPASWAMMILGFGAIGAVLRTMGPARRRALIPGDRLLATQTRPFPDASRTTALVGEQPFARRKAVCRKARNIGRTPALAALLWADVDDAHEAR